MQFTHLWSVVLSGVKMSKARNPIESKGRREDGRPAAEEAAASVEAVDRGSPAQEPPPTIDRPGRVPAAVDGGRGEDGVGWMRAAESGSEEVRNDDRRFYGKFSEDLGLDQDEDAAQFKWIVSVDGYGQILLEGPENRRGRFDADGIDGRGSGGDATGPVVKEQDTGDMLMVTDEPSCVSVFDDVCSSSSSKQETQEVQTHVEVVAIDPSVDPQLSSSCKIGLLDDHDKLGNSEFLCSMKIERNATQENGESGGCLIMPDSQIFDAVALTTVETEQTAPALNDLQRVSFLSFASVSNLNEPMPLVSDQDFSISDFKSEMVVENVLDTKGHMANDLQNRIETIGDVLLPVKSSETSDLSAINLFSESLPFVKNEVDVDIHHSVSRDSEMLKTFEICVTSQTSDATKSQLDVVQENLSPGVLPLVTDFHTSDKVMTATNEASSINVNRLSNSDNRKTTDGMPLMILTRVTASGEDKEVESPGKRIVLVKKSSVVQNASSGVETNSLTEGGEAVSSQAEIKRFVCSQEGCDWSFSTVYKLKRHEETHKGKKDFLCSFEGCNRKFTTIYNLRTHKKLHESPCTQACPQPNCSETFRNKRLLDMHLKLHSNEEKTYRCPHPGCTKAFFSQTCVSSHARVHLHDSLFVCAFDGCGRKFDKLCRLRQHMRSHTGERPYRCTFEGCNWAFSTSSKLCRHLLMHNGQKKWRCPFADCGKMFTRAEHVKGHLVTHTTLRPFPCTSNGCSARFKSKNSLEIHLKRYCQMGNKRSAVGFSCPLEGCGQRFTNRTQLKTHLDGHRDGIDTHEPGNVPIGMPINSLSMMISLDLEDLDSIVQNHQASSSTLDHPLFLGQALPAVVCTTTTSALNLLTLPVLVTQESTSINSLTSTSAIMSGYGKADFSNYLIDQKSKRKPHEQTDDLNVGLTNIVPLDESVVLSEAQHSTSKQMALDMVLSMDEIMTSHAITFRDPETGTIYVQTQLLQDDPPNTDIYLDDDDDDADNNGMATSSHQPSVISAELSSILHDDFSSEDDSGEVTFTGTTINLQDLE